MTFLSTKRENIEFSISVLTLEDCGESMISAVSSRSCRNGDEDEELSGEPDGGESGVGCGDSAEDVEGGVITPLSINIDSSSSRGGSIYGNHLVAYLSCSVCPSTFFRTSMISSRKRSAVMLSAGDTWPKTSSTAGLTFSMICA